MIKNFRIIPRIDIKGVNVIKGIQMEGLRVMGDPSNLSEKYYQDGADELIFLDSVATLYGRNHLHPLIEKIAKNIFIPITVGGGIRSIEDVEELLMSGADKIAINTALVLNPNLITKVANRYGSQCLVVSIEAKKINDGLWEVYTNNGRERTNVMVSDWVRSVIQMGAGEILLTSVDKDGTEKGFDYDLVGMVTSISSVPVIASGGMGSAEDMIKVVEFSNADAIAVGAILHKNKLTINQMRKRAIELNFNLRSYDHE